MFDLACPPKSELVSLLPEAHDKWPARSCFILPTRAVCPKTNPVPGLRGESNLFKHASYTLESVLGVTPFPVDPVHL